MTSFDDLEDLVRGVKRCLIFKDEEKRCQKRKKIKDDNSNFDKKSTKKHPRDDVSEDDEDASLKPFQKKLKRGCIKKNIAVCAMKIFCKKIKKIWNSD
jgi:hypothetical protein